MRNFYKIARAAPIMFIVLASAFLGVTFLAPGGDSGTINDDSKAITGNQDIGSSDTVITKTWQAVESPGGIVTGIIVEKSRSPNPA
jgi:hypothetical protein